MRFLLTGGIMRGMGELLGHGHGAKFGEVITLDWESGEVDRLLLHETKKQYCADIFPSVYFTASSICNGYLYLCCNTQVFVYRYPGMELIREINHPYFNDLHHVTVIGDKMYVACTGLDAVMVFGGDGALEEMKNSLGKDIWHRHSPDVDFRKVASTKPHESHPNFVFEIDGEPWVTRFEQKDAVCLNDMRQVINIEVERPHDGHVYGDFVYFTTVNGNVVVANKHTKQVEDVIDLNRIDARGMPLGWCRGFCLADGKAYVGFTKLRSTKIVRNLRWVKSLATKGVGPKIALPARVARYDLGKRILEAECVIPEDNMSIIFSILSV